ncbi:threonine--tRNA ligase [Candidatus Woesearchaeota archaeon]|nr:threonine--tRNA ligase [Candidatus Woesearchaeota archaeon]
MAKIRLISKTKKEFLYDKPVDGFRIKEDMLAQDPGCKDAKDAIAIRLNGTIYDMSCSIRENGNFEFITFSSGEGKGIFRHSASHVLAKAVKRLFPKARLAIGPAIEDGFYYDFDVEEPFTPADLKKIEEEMRRIVKEDVVFERLDLTRADGKKKTKELGEPYKEELIDDLGDDVTEVSFYKNKGFIDLCRGPHVPSTGCIKAFRLTKIAGAYWRGSSDNKQLQRIYGVAFPTKDELKEYLRLLEEAEKRDHRKLGQKLKLFSFHEQGPGFPFWHPKGLFIFNRLIEFWRDEHKKAGYVEVKTPIILSRKLWEESGHWDNYKDNMYFTKIDNIDFAVKPMNCPGGMLMYKEDVHSYRELPLRVGEIGLVHRHELSGVLSGLLRVRQFHQDDAHIFMTEEQIKDEILGVIKLADRFYSYFGLSYHMELSTRPEKSIGTDEQWNNATEGLKSALDATGREYRINEGDGAFYGPKIDFHIKDAIGRTWQCGTIQLDMALPERFELTYEGKDGQKHRPVMIHRVIYGSLERFIAILIEHYAGKFPLWLSPVQARIVTVADKFNPYAQKVLEKLEAGGIRAELDKRQLTISKKVREAQLDKVNYILVIGEKEEEAGTVNLRTRENEIKGEKKPDDLVHEIKNSVKELS